MSPPENDFDALLERKNQARRRLAEAGFFPAPLGWQTALNRGVPVSCKREGPYYDRRTLRPLAHGTTYYFKFHDTGISLYWIVAKISEDIRFCYPPIGPEKERKVRQYWGDPGRWVARYALERLR